MFKEHVEMGHCEDKSVYIVSRFRYGRRLQVGLSGGLLVDGDQSMQWKTREGGFFPP